MESVNDDSDMLLLLEPSANVKTDSRYIKPVILDAQGTNHDKWSNQFFVG